MNNLNELIIAHRGESFDAPENTHASVNLAWERGALAVEVDVHLSKDRQIIVIHDSNTHRTAERNKEVIDQTLHELKELDAGAFKHSKWKGERIPALQEVMKTVPDNGKLIVEIKCGPDIIPVIKDILRKSDLNTAQIVFIAFDLGTLIAAKKALPEHKFLWIIELDDPEIQNIAIPYPARMIKIIREENLGGINIRADRKIDKNFVDCIKSAKLDFYVWTINDPAEAERYLHMGVDGITTNRAQWLKSQLMQRNFA